MAISKFDLFFYFVTSSTMSWGFDTQPTQLHIPRYHDDIKWKQFPRYWPFVRGIPRSPVNSPHKGQCCGDLMFSLICIWINRWVNNHEAGDLISHRAHYDVIVMYTCKILCDTVWKKKAIIVWHCTHDNKNHTSLPHTWATLSHSLILKSSLQKTHINFFRYFDVFHGLKIYQTTDLVRGKWCSFQNEH